jgi:hypothetical protein
MTTRNDSQHFLLIHDVEKGEFRHEDFGTNFEAAHAELVAAEARWPDESRVRVVLVSSDSLETVKRTHSSWFFGADEAVLAVQSTLRDFQIA